MKERGACPLFLICEQVVPECVGNHEKDQQTEKDIAHFPHILSCLHHISCFCSLQEKYFEENVKTSRNSIFDSEDKYYKA